MALFFSISFGEPADENAVPKSEKIVPKHLAVVIKIKMPI